MSTTPAKARFAPAQPNHDTAKGTTVPVPAGATSVDDWDGGGRLFCGSTNATVEASGWLSEDVHIDTVGLQNDDGAYRWEIVAGPLHPDNPLTATQARQIGEALIAAADELDGLSAGGR